MFVDAQDEPRKEQEFHVEEIVISKEAEEAEKGKGPQVEHSVFREQCGCNIKWTGGRTKMRIMMMAQHESSLQEPGRLAVRSFGRPEQGK